MPAGSNQLSPVCSTREDPDREPTGDPDGEDPESDPKIINAFSQFLVFVFN